MKAVEDIRRSALNRYREFLRSVSASVLLDEPSSFFPWVYRGSKGRKDDSYADSLALYTELYSSSKEKTGRGYSIFTGKVNTRSYGEQTIIREIAITGEKDYLRFIGKEKEYGIFISSLSSLKECSIKAGFSLPAIDSWVQNNLDFLQEEKDEDYYRSIFSALVWLLSNPDSGLYIREIPLSLHTKFIEENERVILSLYEAVTSKKALLSFEETFGLRKKEVLIRYRLPDGREETGLRRADFKVLPELCDLSRVKRVFVVENEIVYLTFPIDGDMMCVYGGGFGVSVLGGVGWLNEKELYYFGDEDEHGFEILALFRSLFPHVKSFLMDMTTYMDHIGYAVKGKSSSSVYDSFLTPGEKEVLDLLRSTPEKSRLEQERISVPYIMEHLTATQT